MAGGAPHARAPRNSFGGVVYTYGPLGFFSVPVFYFTWTAVLSLAYLAVAKAALAAALLWRTRRSYPGWLAVLLTFLVLTLPHLASDFLILAVFLWCVRVLEEPASFADKRWLVPAGGALAAFQLLDKINYGGVSLAITAVAVWWLRPFRWQGRLLAGSFLVAFTVIWVGERAGALRSGSTRRSKSLPGSRPGQPARSRAASGSSAAALIAAIAHLLWRHLQGVERWRRASLFAVSALFSFSFFKEGFVRHDGGHSVLFFGAFGVASLAFAWRKHLRWAAVATLAVTAVVSGAATDWRHPYLLSPGESVQRAFDSARAADRPSSPRGRDERRGHQREARATMLRASGR